MTLAGPGVDQDEIRRHDLAALEGNARAVRRDVADGAGEGEAALAMDHHSAQERAAAIGGAAFRHGRILDWFVLEHHVLPGASRMPL